MITFENRYVKTLISLADLLVKDVHQDGYIDGQVRHFERRAARLGYVKLGSGYFSQAWTHPEIKEFAIKLGFKKEDSGATYAAYCRDNQGKAGIPTIYGLDRYNSCYVVLMDKLVAFDKITELYHAKSLYFKLSGKDKIIKPSVIEKFYDIQSYFAEYRMDKEITCPLYQTAKDIRDFFLGIASFDLHEGNVMVNKFGELIITDPVSFVKTCKKEHHDIVKVNADFRGRTFHDEVQSLTANMVHACFDAPLEWKSCPKQKPNIERGATLARKPAFLIAKDARNGIKRNL